ncbi:alpha/beta fold hydrolase [Pseudonocardia phyllosphaerae]|uniref:alpha/beta fold hydrolase n=1 Tax=Pseudonocardia phyllosphaerae TaxID=3390502 RepID=UPI00397BE6DC
MPLHFHLAGDPAGRPILAIHGVTGHGLRWRPLVEALPHRRWIGVDVRGHGDSPWTPPWTLEQHVTDAVGVLDELGIARADVVGHSFGGAIATHLSRSAPGRVRRLALLDPAIGLDPELMLEFAENTCDDESWPTREQARDAKAGDWPDVPSEILDDELDTHLEWRGDAWRWRYSRASVVAAWSQMARVAVVPPRGTPTLVVPAGRADYVSGEWLAACRARLGDDLRVVPLDAGHMVFLERPGEVAAALGEFLD